MVTQRDNRNRGPNEMVEPRFLVDEQFDLVQVPSLAVWDALRQQPHTSLKEARAMGIRDFRNPEAQLKGAEMDIGNFKTVFGNAVCRGSVQ